MRRSAPSPRSCRRSRSISILSAPISRLAILTADEFVNHLFTSYPELARRELGNLFASNLRPRSSKWFSTHASDEELDKGTEERQYLAHISDVQWRAMYDSSAQFVRATKEADHDFAAFGAASTIIGGIGNFANSASRFSNRFG